MKSDISSPSPISSVTALVTKVSVPVGDHELATDWMVRLMLLAMDRAHFLSADLLPPVPPSEPEWRLVQRFASAAEASVWQTSASRIELFDELKPDGACAKLTVSEESVPESGNRGAVATAITTQLKPGMEEQYLEWEKKIQSVQARSTGFRGSFIQPPTAGTTGRWTTVIHFDSPASLDKWFACEERQKLVAESENFVAKTNYQRMSNSFPGWFPTDDAGNPPPNWKSAMLVLLGLYPIVMLEIKYLNPQLHALGPAMGNFLGNIASCALTTWVTMPIFIRIFGLWLFPKPTTPKWQVHGLSAVICLLYVLEIIALRSLL